MGRERPFVQDWRFTARVRTISWITYSEAAERLALTLSTRPGNTPEPPPPKLRAPEVKTRHAQRGASFCKG
jgi:hypothetical protein